MNIEILANSIAESLPVGSTQRTTCPACAGGSSRETTFTVGREPDRVWWKCFRDSCGEAGVTGCYYQPPAEVARRLDRIKPYTQHTTRLADEDYAYFFERFTLTREDVHGRILRGSTGYIMPYRDPLGNLRGHVVRRAAWKGEPKNYWLEDGYDGPKTVTYPSTTAPVQGWYKTRTGRSEVAVLVEDQISAMKVSAAGQNAVALLGTGVNVEKIRDLRKDGVAKLLIALDPDAQGTAQQIRNKWGGYFEKCRLIALEADPKDTPLDELQEALR